MSPREDTGPEIIVGGTGGLWPAGEMVEGYRPRLGEGSSWRSLSPEGGEGLQCICRSGEGGCTRGGGWGNKIWGHDEHGGIRGQGAPHLNQQACWGLEGQKARYEVCEFFMAVLPQGIGLRWHELEKTRKQRGDGQGEINSAVQTWADVSHCTTVGHTTSSKV